MKKEKMGKKKKRVKNRAFHWPMKKKRKRDG